MKTYMITIHDDKGLVYCNDIEAESPQAAIVIGVAEMDTMSVSKVYDFIRARLN